MEFLQEIKQVILLPRAFFQRQAEEKKLRTAVIALSVMIIIQFLVGLVSLVGEMINPILLPIIGTNNTLILLLLVPIMVLVFLLLVVAIGVGIRHLLARLVGGVGEFKALYTCTLFLQAAFSALIIPLNLLDTFLFFPGSEIIMKGIGICLFICLFIWMFYLDVLAVKICYKLSTTKAVVVNLIPLGLVVMLCIALSVAVM